MQDKSSVVLSFTYNKSENRKKRQHAADCNLVAQKGKMIANIWRISTLEKNSLLTSSMLSINPVSLWTLCLKVRLTHIKIHHYSFWFCCYYCYDLHPLTCQLLKSEGLLVFPVSHCKFKVSLIFVGLCMLTFKKLSWRHWPKIFAFLWHFSQSELSEDYRSAGKLHIETFGVVSLGFVMFFLMLLHC